MLEQQLNALSSRSIRFLLFTTITFCLFTSLFYYGSDIFFTPSVDLPTERYVDFLYHTVLWSAVAAMPFVVYYLLIGFHPLDLPLHAWMITAWGALNILIPVVAAFWGDNSYIMSSDISSVAYKFTFFSTLFVYFYAKIGGFEEDYSSKSNYSSTYGYYGKKTHYK
jgi:hypothetical protein